MAETVAIIDYGSGNLRSATKAFERAKREANLSTEIILTNQPEIVAKADRIVLPGVGAFADCAQGLDAVNGMRDAIDEAILAKGRPFLGICVGMQLMAARGLEKTTTQGFGWIEGDVAPIEVKDPNLKIPQMGWNTLHLTQDHSLFDGIKTGPDGLHAYFVHSYHLKARHAHQVLATVDYGGTVTAAVINGNRVGTQFHPEKSQALGLQFITNFLKWAP